jgi:hypothetical protein
LQDARRRERRLVEGLEPYADRNNWMYYDGWRATDFYLDRPDADQYEDDPGIIARKG